MGLDTRRHKAEQFVRFQHQFARARTRRDLDEFKHTLDGLLTRVRLQTKQQVPLATIPPAPISDTDGTSRQGFDQSMRDLLVRVHGRPLPRPEPASPRPRRGTWWSNQPVFGYRVWELVDNEMHGARTVWTEPHKEAECLNRRGNPEQPVPHEVGICGNPPCGIYAMKDADQIRNLVETTLERCRTPVTLAVGIVAMSGRVIEHRQGYRAERVNVAALGLVSGPVDDWIEISFTVDPKMIRTAFASPQQARSALRPTNLPAREACEGVFQLLARSELTAGY